MRGRGEGRGYLDHERDENSRKTRNASPEQRCFVGCRVRFCLAAVLTGRRLAQDFPFDLLDQKRQVGRVKLTPHQELLAEIQVV